MKPVKYIVLGISILLFLFVFRSLLAPAVDGFFTFITRKNIRSGFEFKTKEECEKNKGDWGRAGIFPNEFCRIPMSDAGKTCIAGFQCASGTCFTAYRLRNNPFIATGVCPKYIQTFGCIQEVHFGFTSRAICRD